MYLSPAYLLSFLLLFFPTLHATEKPPLQLAERYHDGIDLQDYWVSEKYDGIRAYWDGSQLLSRQGNPIQAPDWFINVLPTQRLDGELWAGRNQFEQTSSIVRKQQAIDHEWRRIRYMVFDLPQLDTHFDQRLKQLQSLLKNSPDWLVPAPQWKTTSHQQLQQQLTEYVAQGAEGLMLHRGKASYHSGRTSDLLKVKRYQDAEATVIAYKTGKGKYQGQMGSLLVELSSGIQFYIGSGFSDPLRKNPPAIGSIISFKYFGLTRNGIPRHASYLRQRSDHNF